VATKTDVSVTGLEATTSWIENAHDLEKEEFFKILHEDITKRLNVKTEGGNNNE